MARESWRRAGRREKELLRTLDLPLEPKPPSVWYPTVLGYEREVDAETGDPLPWIRCAGGRLWNGLWPHGHSPSGVERYGLTA